MRQVVEDPRHHRQARSVAVLELEVGQSRSTRRSAVRPGRWRRAGPRRVGPRVPCPQQRGAGGWSRSRPLSRPSGPGGNGTPHPPAHPDGDRVDDHVAPAHLEQAGHQHVQAVAGSPSETMTSPGANSTSGRWAARWNTSVTSPIVEPGRTGQSVSPPLDAAAAACTSRPVKLDLGERAQELLVCGLAQYRSEMAVTGLVMATRGSTSMPASTSDRRMAASSRPSSPSARSRNPSRS